MDLPFEARAFSAPGKALLAGGYLVLDSKYKSYVVALSCCMHSVISQKLSASKDKIYVKITSSQFNNDCWCYDIRPDDSYVPRLVTGSKNPFLEKALFNVFQYFQPSTDTCNDIYIDIFSDAEYHSQKQTIVKKNQYKEFNFHKSVISEVPKTGLGSSAGLVTVVVSALISCFKKDLNVRSLDDLRLIHNLAQVSHCQAQGKVGSGFDVAAATFGSILYQRFKPELISSLPEPEDACYHNALEYLVNKADWNVIIDRITLPPRMRLIMGDVDGGSETTKLVSKVQNWYTSHLPQSLEIFSTINKGNMDFISGLNELNEISRKNPTQYEQLIDELNNCDIIKSPVLLKIQNSIFMVRNGFRLITKESGADIEPNVQTNLIDNSIKLLGVLTGMVPGAGGYDAIYLITTEDTNLSAQTKDNEAFSNVTWLDLKQQEFGIVEENPLHYKNFQSL